MKTFSAICATLLLVPAVHATTIFSVTGSNGGNILTGLISAASVGWTQTDTYSAVTISAPVANGDSVSHTLFAFLTNSVGAGTTVANEIANSSSVIAANSGDVSPTLFSGLVLAPGTYYLTLAGDSDFIRWRDAAAGDSVALDAGVSIAMLPATFGSYGGGYAPAHSTSSAASEDSKISVTGTLVSSVPEPSYWVVLGPSMFGSWLMRKRTRKNFNRGYKTEHSSKGR